MSSKEIEKLLELTLFTNIVSRPVTSETLYQPCTVCRKSFLVADQVILHICTTGTKQSAIHATCFITHMAINDVRACPGCYEVIDVLDQAKIEDAVNLAKTYHSQQRDLQKKVCANWTKVKSTFEELMTDITKDDPILHTGRLDDLDESHVSILKENFQWKVRQLIDAEIFEGETIWALKYIKSNFERFWKPVKMGKLRLNQALVRLRLGFHKMNTLSSIPDDRLGQRLKQIIRAALAFTLEDASRQGLDFNVIRRFKTWAAKIDGYGLLLEVLDGKGENKITMDDFCLRISQH